MVLVILTIAAKVTLCNHIMTLSCHSVFISICSLSVFYIQFFCGFIQYLCYVLSITLRFTVQLLLGLARAVTPRSKPHRTRGHILLSHFNSPNLEGQVPIFISPRNKVAQLYPQALGSFFVAT
jgi:hypothetical protein